MQKTCDYKKLRDKIRKIKLVLKLRREGKTYDEIANIANLPHRTVASLIYRTNKDYKDLK